MSGAERGLRVGVVGATGALGGEILAVLDESSLRIEELVPVATDRSLGEEIEFQGADCPVLAGPPRVGALDLLFRFILLITPVTAVAVLATKSTLTDVV